LLDSQSRCAGIAHDKAPRLLDKVTSAIDLEDLLGSVYLAEGLDQALALRPQLAAGESVVTKEGIWLGPNWLRVSKGQDATSGVLERQQELESLDSRIAIAEARIVELEDEGDQQQAELKNIESQQAELRRT